MGDASGLRQGSRSGCRNVTVSLSPVVSVFFIMCFNPIPDQTGVRRSLDFTNQMS